MPSRGGYRPGALTAHGGLFPQSELLTSKGPITGRQSLIQLVLGAARARYLIAARLHQIVLRHDGRSKHRGPLVAARGLWSRVVRPGLLSSMAHVTWARAASRRLRQAARPRSASPRTAPRGLEMHGLELPGSGCASDGLSGWVERLGLCGRGLCWARAQRPRLARPAGCYPPIVRRSRIMRVGSKVPGLVRP
jgi:hypothetical protein